MAASRLSIRGCTYDASVSLSQHRHDRFPPRRADAADRGDVACLALGRPTIVGFVLAASGQVRLPARLWVLDAALEQVLEAAEAGSPIGRALEVWAQPVTGTHGRFPALHATVRDLVAGGHLVPRDSGAA